VGINGHQAEEEHKFHPQTDGQTEVVNKTMIQLLKGYCSKHPKLWDQHLCYVQHAYNQAKQSYT